VAPVSVDTRRQSPPNGHSQTGLSTHASVVHWPPCGEKVHGCWGFSWDVNVVKLGLALMTPRVPLVLRYAQPSGAPTLDTVNATQPGVMSQEYLKASVPYCAPESNNGGFGGGVAVA
jgi:hypothetical protein